MVCSITSEQYLPSRISRALLIPLWIKFCSVFFLTALAKGTCFKCTVQWCLVHFAITFKSDYLVKACFEFYSIMWIISNSGILVAAVSRLLICANSQFLLARRLKSLGFPRWQILTKIWLPLHCNQNTEKSAWLIPFNTTKHSKGRPWYFKHL